MYYSIYEFNRSVIEPFAEMAQSFSRLYLNPFTGSQHDKFSQRLNASADLFYRLVKNYDRPAFGLNETQVLGKDVAVVERIEIKKDFCELKRFKRYSDDAIVLKHMKDQPVVLIVAPLSGHYSTLLRDTAQSMMADHKVYITDWLNARNVPVDKGEFGLDDYVNYVQEFIRHIQSKYGNCHVVSVCQPTVPVLGAISLMASRGELTPLSMTMMGGPIDATKSPTAVNNLATENSIEWFENNVIQTVPSNFAGSGRSVYPGFLQHMGFVAMNPSRHAKSHWNYFEDLLQGDEEGADYHRKFYDEYNAVLDLDAKFYLDTIATVFQNFDLVRGTWLVKNEQGEPQLVKPQDIVSTALLTVEGELDDISGQGQTFAAHTLCSGIPESEREHITVEGAGHYGIFSGSKWRKTGYPQLKNFIAKHNNR